ALTGSLIELGQNGLAGVRFQKIGVPPFATITEARIQFTAGAASAAGNVADLHIRVVNQPDVAFTAGNPPAPVDLSTLPFLNSAVDWAPGPWTLDDAVASEDKQLTPDLQALLQAVVSHKDYTPTSAVAFVIGGFGRRSARSFEGSTSKPAPPFLIIKYTPLKTTTEFSACFAQGEDPATVCGGRVNNAVTGMAVKCKVASGCSCKVKPVADAKRFANVCNDSCGPKPVPDDCNPAGFAQATQAAPGQPPVCIAHSPLGSALFGQRSACDIDPGQSNVHARIFKGTDSSSSDGAPRGRIEFVGAPRPEAPSAVGMTHRLNVADMTFPSHNLLASDSVVNQLTGVGESTVNAFVFNDGTGSFSPGLTNHAMRGNLVGGDAIAVVRANDGPLAI